MPSLPSIHRQFIAAIEEAYQSIQFGNINLSTRSRTEKEKKFLDNIYEISFLKVLVAWEEFLELSFMAYMSGKVTKKHKPKLYLRKITEDHARKILCGTLDYPDWTKIDDICTLAKLYFVGGTPFVMPLQEIETYFNDMKKIRNAIVHISINSKGKFAGLARAKTSSYRPDMTPGDFLACKIRRNSIETFFENYISFLRVAADKIVKL